ncbi:MAG TPA: recombinase, partial [Ruminococcaceae bacterium]|nr:recombinase [Oscillospiraceae bacterium]
MARVHGMPEAGWKVAVYICLSKEDGNDESLSVGNQKKIALDYLERSFEGVCRTVDFYTDDGLTGTDYDRPGFQRMLRGIEAGKIDCVVCKNLSRAFRNYADQGYFLENYFP